MKLLDKFKAAGAGEYFQAMATVRVGQLCQNWLETDVGMYVIGRAEEYEMDVLRELAACDPADRSKIMQLQERAKVPGLLLQFIDDAVSEGEAAKIQIEENET